MSYEYTTPVERRRVYTEGRQAFIESKGRGYNPHARNNLTLAVSWWHGWDTAEEESKSKRSPVAKYDQMTQPGYDLTESQRHSRRAYTSKN